jgi:hypothetical protein
MNDIHQWLRDGDPSAYETPPSDAEMAELLVRLRRDPGASHAGVSLPSPFRRWRLATVAAAFVAVAVWGSALKWNPAEAARKEALAAVSPQPARELYFTTPEGIRVIWIFKSPSSE